jgi:hypothetical protein
MAEFHSGVTGRKRIAPTSSDDDPIAALPPFVSVTHTAAALCISRATVWRRIADGTLEIASGSGAGRKRLVLIQPRAWLKRPGPRPPSRSRPER